MIQFDRGLAFRFIATGILNTAVGLLVFAIVFKAFESIDIAIVSVSVFGIFFNFFTIGGYAFRMLLAKKFPRFILAYGSIFLLNRVGQHYFSVYPVSPITIQIFLAPPLAIMSFAILKYFVFFPEKRK